MGYNQGNKPRRPLAVKIQTNMAEAGEAFGNIAGVVAKKYYSEEMRKPRLKERAKYAEDKGEYKAKKLRDRSKKLFGTTTSTDGTTGGKIGKDNTDGVTRGISKLETIQTPAPNQVPNPDPKMVEMPNSTANMPSGEDLAKQVMNQKFGPKTKVGPFNPENTNSSLYKTLGKGPSGITEASLKREKDAKSAVKAVTNILFPGLNMTAPDAFAKGMKRKARYTK